MQALGFIEAPFLSISAMLAQEAVTAADVHILGFESTGNEYLIVRLTGDVSQVRAALDAVEKLAPQLGASIITGTIPRPAEGFDPMIHFPNANNPLYGGRDQFLPADYPTNPDSSNHMKPQAIGILETQGLTAILEATDAMLKAADVKLVGKEKIGAAYVTVVVSGDVAAVSAAIEAGKQAVGPLGKVIAGHVIARPHDDLLALLPK
ncbi:MAG: BMC domain-containing protein [Verrucomicrobiales bacterium]